SRSALSDTTSVSWPSAGRAITSLRSSSNSSPVVNSRISSSLPASLASCSLTKLSFAARRNVAWSKPAGTAAAAAAVAGAPPAGNCTRSLPPMPANCTFSGAGSVRRRPKARNAMKATIASSATRRIVERPVPLSAQASKPPSASPPRMPPSMPHLLPCCAGAACCCCCAGLAGVAAGGVVTLRCVPTERPPPRRFAASASVANTIAPSIRAESRETSFFIGRILQAPMLSNPEPPVHRNDPGGEIEHFDAVEPRRAHHRGERRLVGMHADRFREVAIGGSVARNALAEPRQDLEGVKVIRRHERLPHLRELEHHQPAAGLQHAPHLGERRILARHVAQAEGDRDAVEALGRERQPLA